MHICVIVLAYSAVCNINTASPRGVGRLMN